MKKIVAILFILLLPAFGSKAAQADCTFPDLSFLLDTPCVPYRMGYAFSEDLLCDAYLWAYPESWPDGGDELLAALAHIQGGWTWEAGTLEGYDAFFLTGRAGEQAMLVSDFEGSVLALVPVGCRIEAVAGSQDEAAVHAPDEPSPTQPKTAGHWEWQTQEADCPACVGGWCSVCNGSGSYRLHGETVLCSRLCSACDGAGTIRQQSYVFIPGP